MTLQNITTILGAFKMPPRTAIQVADRVIATISNMPYGSHLDIILLTTLLCINEQDNELFKNIASGNFQYQDTNGNDIKLEKFLCERFENKQCILNFEVCLEEYREFFSKQHSQSKRIFDKIFRSNPHPSLQINCTDYFQHTYLNILGSDSSSILFVTTGPIRTPQYEETSQLNKAINNLEKNRLPINSTSEYGKLWFEAEYYRGQFDKIKLEKYQDYVELASALDWIDGDTGSDDA
ncbi:hypothetical protein ACMUMQ_15640 [Marinomonas sp. 2405UD66-6]|uniref:hypothetical protein n=1 Tax=Marinomonas sp. 2405UD66-6 TaxID=3391834 RepID=UPI0039C9D6FA